MHSTALITACEKLWMLETTLQFRGVMRDRRSPFRAGDIPTKVRELSGIVHRLQRYQGNVSVADVGHCNVNSQPISGKWPFNVSLVKYRMHG